MKKNMGIVDRIIRAVIAAVISICYFMHIIDGMTATILLVLGGVFLFTSLISICPLYIPFGIKTCKNDK